ncbi:MAG TPA: nitroreductase/quinone reductase family protein [Actinomycetota bacterium]|nr:nitroreductase/quinone reductase family protein [Actinomycetota bacterium]
MAGDALQHLADVQEISIGFRRPDGSTGSTPVWVVQVGDNIFVRSIRGPRGGWYRRLRANPNGEVRDAAHVHPVHAEPIADADTLAEVTCAYATKYAGSPYVQPLLEEPAIGATLRLGPS